VRLLAIVELLVLSGAVGFGVYCISCALHVWHARGGATSGAPAHRGMILGLRRGAAALWVLGLAGIVVSVAWHLVAPREGLLVGRGMFTVRRPTELEVGGLTAGDEVAKGAVLARYYRPEREAEIEVLQLRRQSIQLQQDILSSEPLSADPLINAQIMELSGQQQSLRTDMNNLVLEKDRVERDALRDRVSRRDEINRLAQEFDRLQSEREQSFQAWQLHRDEVTRHAALRRKNVISVQEFAEKETRARYHQVQVQKLDGQAENVRRTTAKLEEGLGEMEAVSRQQSEALAESVAATQAKIRDVTARLETLQAQRAQDLARAEQRRGKARKKLDIEHRQIERELGGLQESLEVRAPFAGRVAYRAPSPSSVRNGAPLVVLAKADQFRFQIQLPRWMLRSLQAAGAVPLELVEDLDREEPRRFVRRHFQGALAGWIGLPDHRGYAIAELHCQPPPESVAILALGERVAARLVWRPPLYTVPSVVLSSLAAAVGLGVWGYLRTRVPRALESPAVASLPNPHRPATVHVGTEYGAEGVMLRMLGAQLRQCLVGREPDGNVIAAAEWALDRHRARAIRLLALGLSPDDELREHIEGLLRENAQFDQSAEAEPANGDGLPRRLYNVLRAVTPECLPARKLP